MLYHLCSSEGPRPEPIGLLKRVQCISCKSRCKRDANDAYDIVVVDIYHPLQQEIGRRYDDDDGKNTGDGNGYPCAVIVCHMSILNAGWETMRYSPKRD